jgi:hypothetical protein
MSLNSVQCSRLSKAANVGSKQSLMNRDLLCRSYVEIHSILQRMLRKWFSEPIVPLSRTTSTPRFRAAQEDARWNLFLTQRIHVFHNHFSENGKKNMSLDGKLALSDVY